MKKFGFLFTLSCMCGIFLMAAPLKAAETNDGEAGRLLMCDCYDTPVIKVDDFVEHDKKTISSRITNCQENYLITGFTQTPESNPAQMGQFLIISTVRCCRVCLP